MGTVLAGLTHVSWSDLHDAQGSARGVPALLSKVAWADRDTASIALDELGDRVCELGFVLSEATAPTVPFLLELAGAPRVQCKAELLELLTRIFAAEQWRAVADAAGSEYKKGYEEQVGWEADSHAAVFSGRGVVEGLAASVDPAVAEAAQTLLRVLDDRRRRER
ncbi:hypothetical protein [Streptomyces sp. NPDC059479]|uniref:hypothetical protein n=1 Tax=Streptomyces sp. NPDC059479 TaxID=3346848 RepID=UPI0036A43697